MQNNQGKLIVIEGIDGSGKATQTKKLVERLKQMGGIVEEHAFPRHGQEFFGKLVDRYLNNEFGEATKLDPYVASLFYACDRWEAKTLLNNWLEQGKVVVVDRYVTSNMGHQGAKILDLGKREDFLAWLNKMEFEVFQIPRPDLVVYLSVSTEVVYDLLTKRNNQSGRNLDGLEKDMNHLVVASATYQYLCGRFDYWHRVECMQQGQMLGVDEIHERVWQVVKGVL